MKKLYLLLGIAALFACSDDNTEPPVPAPVEPDKATIELDVTNVQLPRSGGSAEVTVTANYDDWDFKNTESWLSVQKSGNKLIFSANENTTSERNTATVAVTVLGEGEENTASATINVVQNDASLIIEIKLDRDGLTMVAPVLGMLECTIDWGDGKTEPLTGNIDGVFSFQPTHFYEKSGTYQIRIYGFMPRIGIGSPFTDVELAYITSVIQWGNTGLTSMQNALKGCINLTSIPSDTDGSFTNVTTFSNAFYGCTSLREIPADLFVNCDKVETFSFCFDDAGLESIPAGLFDNCIGTETFASVFSGCPLISIPDELFVKCVSAKTFSSVFFGCQFLQSIPENLFKGCEKAEAFTYAFRQCPSLTEIPEGLFSPCPLAKDFAGLFTMCYSLASIPEGLFANNPKAENFNYSFTECTSLTEIPAGLFDSNRAVKSFQATFRNCIRLSSETPYTTIEGKKVHLYERSKYPGQFIAPSTYEYCFSNCTELMDYEYMQQNYPDWSKPYLR